MPRTRRGARPGRGGLHQCRARGRTQTNLAGALCDRRLRPRHLLRQPPEVQAAQSEARQRLHVRSFQGRAALPGSQARRPHLALLVRARLAVVHSPRGWHHQHRRGRLALLHEGPQLRRARVLHGDHREESGAGRAIGECRAGQRGRGDGQLLLRVQARLRAEFPDGGRCFRIRGPRVLHRRDAGDEQRYGGRQDRGHLSSRAGTGGARAQALPAPDALRPEGVFLVHLPHDGADAA